MADKDNLSGLAWFKKNQASYPNSTKVGDLAGSFKSGTQSFIKALEDAGATVKVSSTKRHATRAHLMHYSWKLAKGQTKAASIPKLSGLDIEWDHGDEKTSQQAAQEMIGPQGFDMDFIASLTSNHIKGLAIDMTISWNGELKIKDAKGKDVTIKTSPRNGQNKELHTVGKSYGVVKHLTDRPHWSVDGK